MLDPVSNLKLYPKQSNSGKATKTTSGFKIPKAIADYLSDNGGTIEIFFKHDLVNNVPGYPIGRENLVPVDGNYGTTGLYLNSAKLAYLFYVDGSVGPNCAINVSSLTDGAYYIAKLTIAATLSFTMQKVTKVNNLNVIGTAVNSTTTAKGPLKANCDLGVFSGCYSSGSLSAGSKHEIVYVKIKNNAGECLSEVYINNGVDNFVTDVCNKTHYTILNEDNFPTFWKKQDYIHYNFRYGNTIWQRDSDNAIIRIPNDENQNEIGFTPASGYTRIANYKECKKNFNQCESLFCLDNVSAGEQVMIVTGADPDHVLFAESTGVAKNVDIADIYSDVVGLVKDRGHLYINQDSDKNMMLYKTDKGVDTPEDLKIWKYVK